MSHKSCSKVVGSWEVTKSPQQTHVPRCSKYVLSIHLKTCRVIIISQYLPFDSALKRPAGSEAQHVFTPAFAPAFACSFCAWVGDLGYRATRSIGFVSHEEMHGKSGWRCHSWQRQAQCPALSSHPRRHLGSHGEPLASTFYFLHPKKNHLESI